MNITSFSTAVSSFFQNNRRLAIGIVMALLFSLSYFAYSSYAHRNLDAQMRADIVREAAAGESAAAAQAMRARPQLWAQREFSVSEYSTLFAEGRLVAIGLPDGSSSKTANPHIYLVTRSGELGYVADTWRGSLTDQSMKERS